MDGNTMDLSLVYSLDNLKSGMRFIAEVVKNIVSETSGSGFETVQTRHGKQSGDLRVF